MANPVVISAAITGAMTVPSQSPNIPISVEEIAQSAVEAREAGAAIVHVHVREQDGRPSARLELFEQVYEKITSSCDAIVQFTTGGGVGMTIAERSRVVPSLRPEMATFNTGSFNFGIFPIKDRIKDWRYDWEEEYLESSRDYVFRNTFKDLEYMCNTLRENGTKPELEVYDVGHLYSVAHLLDRGLLDVPVHIQFVMGVLGSVGPRPEELMHFHERAKALLGDHTWSVAGIGYRGQFHLATLSLILGGNVRVGLEDNLRIAPGKLAQTNAELVAKIVRIAAELDRTPASPNEAREILGIKNQRS
ncbi:MAG: 3-keto-5-aminohexanoate cleavage protein [Actinomycetota bacterium]|nr:3-keto-5-aminohexanoate cleavage protein [Actinomycetota bacterium]